MLTSPSVERHVGPASSRSEPRARVGRRDTRGIRLTDAREDRILTVLRYAVRFALLAASFGFVAACGVTSPDDTSPPGSDASFDASSEGEAGTPRCKETVAQGCSSGNLSYFGVNPCTTHPDQIHVAWSITNRVACGLWVCGNDWVEVGLSPTVTDSDTWSYLFDAASGALIEVDVSSWSLGKDYCLAGSEEPPSVPSPCTASPSCNAGCDVSPADCSSYNEGYSCGPVTTMTSCDGSKNAFAECVCEWDGIWSCSDPEGGVAEFGACDAGAD